jgi:tripartite-type tricarboxylate transporter receptor subunit TctC
MKFPRRRFLQLAAGAAALPVSRIARAQTYPARPVRIVVGFPPGGSSDIYARLIGQSLSERLGQPFVIENRPGAAGNIATEAVVNAPPDGYTLLFVTLSNAINATLYDKLNYNFLRDMVPVASIARSPAVLVVNLEIPTKTVAEFIAYAKANPSKLNMASAGMGSVQHIYGELFKTMSGVDLQHVPYRGGSQPLADLVGGQVQVIFDPISTSNELIKTGKVRPLAVTTATRLEALPGIPTVAEFLPGYEASGWLGIAVSKGTPLELVNRLNTQINSSLADPRMKGRIADLSGIVLVGSPADFTRLITEDTEKWAKVIRTANIKPE